MGIITVLNCPIPIGSRNPFHDSIASNAAFAHFENSDGANIFDSNEGSPHPQMFYTFRLSPQRAIGLARQVCC
jgi:hypothetical protein